jgi:nucleoid-associated protein YgaU
MASVAANLDAYGASALAFLNATVGSPSAAPNNMMMSDSAGAFTISAGFSNPFGSINERILTMNPSIFLRISTVRPDYTLVPGDESGTIAREFYRTPTVWDHIQTFNNIPDSTKMPAGLVIKLPDLV